MKKICKKSYDFIYKVEKTTTLREFLREKEFSTRFIRQVTLGHLVYINNILSFTNGPVESGDSIGICLPQEESQIPIVDKDLEILYEDRDYIIVNKPYGISVHPAKGTGPDTLSGRVANYYKNQGLRRKIRPVSRLDKETSGILIFAKHSPAQEHLQREQKKGNFFKRYIATTLNVPNPPQGMIEESLTWDSNLKIGKVDRQGKKSCTEYKVIDESESTIISCILHTGRTHQIRIHLSHLGCPILGDEKYGGHPFRRMCLHCIEVEFPGFESEEIIHINTKFPKDF
ncbi:MAG: RluA family pseudouridine synthase [Tissierellia bacterium]|nr:RluA family pseudouridine synthase [Tissierellia bacterium]